MKRNTRITICVILALVPVMFASGCKKKNKQPRMKDLLLGTWYMSKGRSYVITTMSSNGNWTSGVRVKGLSSKVVEKKGSASGSWHVEDKNLVIKVMKSNIQDIWENGRTLFCELVKINKDLMTLKYPSGRVITWKKAQVTKKGAKEVNLSPVLKIPPIAVNLNKMSSNDRDRYLCLDLELDLQTLIPGEKPAQFHPKARDAAILFLSSLLYKDVKTFDAVKIVKKKLEKILNPYLGGTLKDIKINSVMITSSIDKVNEFILEHTPKPAVSKNKKGKKKT